MRQNMNNLSLIVKRAKNQMSWYDDIKNAKPTDRTGDVIADWSRKRDAYKNNMLLAMTLSLEWIGAETSSMSKAAIRKRFEKDFICSNGRNIQIKK